MQRPRVLVNHIGYDSRGRKKLIVQAAGPDELESFQVIDAGGRPALERSLDAPCTVDRWTQGVFRRGDFSALHEPGVYRVVAIGRAGTVTSEPFTVAPRLLAETSIPDALSYLKSQRCSGPFDRADRRVPFSGEAREPVDVHGGWFDASGDTSKYLSHLNYTNFMVPQQTPLVVWALLEAAALLRAETSTRLRGLEWRLLDEALHGADFLVRMQDPAGYFYVTVFDGWSKDVRAREISAYATQQGRRSSDYQAGFREGGGMAIAALARAATLAEGGELPPPAYLAAAEKGFAHLIVHNVAYLPDGQENVIDDYCALLAATELYHATGNDAYLAAARSRRESLVKRLHRDQTFSGFWRADANGDRPFFHAVEAGLPVVALLRYGAVESDARLRNAAAEAAQVSLGFELAVTREVANPFGYARQYVSEPGQPRRSAFFFPHRNESGYWWQGENARLASLAAAAYMERSFTSPGQRRALDVYAADQLDWIFGLNPFDTCMQAGRGRNTPDYMPDWPNAPGGVCNGITGGVDDEHDIALLPSPCDRDPAQNWRWSEQWIPHAAWLVLALAAQQRALSSPVGTPSG